MVQVTMILWEVDDDNDAEVDFTEFRTAYYRARDDTTGCEPRKLYHIVEFMIHDKNRSGTIDIDECMSILQQRYAKVRTRGTLACARSPHRRGLRATQDIVDASVKRVFDDAERKYVTLKQFMEVNRLASKDALRKIPSNVPAVRSLSFAKDPSKILAI